MNSLRRINIKTFGKKFSSAQIRNASGSSALDAIPAALQKNVWRKSNTLYLAYIVTGCIILEGFYGGLTSAIWETCNSGVRSCYFKNSL
jgi:hypothetical protein